MFKNLFQNFQDPVIRKALFTGITLILGLIGAILVRRILDSLRIDAKKRQQFKKWAIYLVSFILPSALLRSRALP